MSFEMTPQDPTPSYSAQPIQPKPSPQQANANESHLQLQAVKLTGGQSFALGLIAFSCFVSTGLLIGVLAMAVRLGGTVTSSPPNFGFGKSWIRSGDWSGQ